MPRSSILSAHRARSAPSLLQSHVFTFQAHVPKCPTMPQIRKMISPTHAIAPSLTVPSFPRPFTVDFSRFNVGLWSVLRRFDVGFMSLSRRFFRTSLPRRLPNPKPPLIFHNPPSPKHLFFLLPRQTTQNIRETQTRTSTPKPHPKTRLPIRHLSIIFLQDNHLSRLSGRWNC